jgi:Domain of unknown function (DUF4407)
MKNNKYQHMKRDYYELPTPSKIMKFLWNCAGGDRYLLERSTYSDQIKYMCLGGIVFATGAMAGLAGGYAFYTIFSPKDPKMGDLIISIPHIFLAILFGCIWGLIIFNIDRFIVTSTGKGDGTEKITMDEFKTAIPRIIMGMIIAITISKPIEIRMFQTEIQAKLYEKKQDQLNIYRKGIEKNYMPSINDIQKEIDGLQKKIDEKYLDYQNKYNLWNDCTIKRSGNCPMHKAESDIALSVWNSAKNSLDPLILIKTKEKKDWQDRMNEALGNAKLNSDSLNGLLERIKISEEIAGFWISLFITLLFMAIELTPIFFKLMLTKTTYDYLSENRDELIKADYGIEVKYDYYEAKNKDGKVREGIERHLVINHDAERKIFEKIKVTEIQKELTEYAVAKYKEREMKKIDANLDEYINKINPNDEPNSEV